MERERSRTRRKLVELSTRGRRAHATLTIRGFHFRQMNRREFYKRISGVLDPGRLQDKKVAVIGLGSGGSRVAAELARLGINLCLVDRPKERLQEHNIVRHLLDYRSLGKAKVAELTKCLRHVNPAASLTPCSLDVVRNPPLLARMLERWQPDLIAVCTDNEASKHAVNQAATRLGIAQIGAGVYDGGIGGEVYRVLPGQACYGCIASQIQGRRPEPRNAVQSDYNTLNVPEAPTTSALNLDIEQIALLHSRVALDYLLGGHSEFLGVPLQTNLFVFANRAVPGTFSRPLHCDFYGIPKRADCLCCGQAPEDLDGAAARILSGLRIERPHPATPM